MKKILFILAGIIILRFCMFPIISFGNNTTEVRLNVYEIKVSCDKNGSFVVNENNYINEKNFFVGEDATIHITAIANSGYIIDSIECKPQCNFTLENNQLAIKNITDNINVKIRVKSTEIPVAGLDSNDNQNIKDDTKEQSNNICLWCILLIIFVLIINFYLIFKRNTKKSR